MEDARNLYERIVAPVEKTMIATIARIVRSDEAVDVLQNSLEDVWRRIGKISRHPNPQGYIIRICLSRSYDALRREARRRRVEKALPPRAPSDECPPADAAAIRAAVGLLPRKQARAVMLRSLENLSYEAIARILDCSPQTARSHYSKGLSRLRTILTKQNFRSSFAEADNDK